MPHVRQRSEVALFGFVSTQCIASEVLIKASFIEKSTNLLIGGSLSRAYYHGDGLLSTDPSKIQAIVDWP